MTALQTTGLMVQNEERMEWHMKGRNVISSDEDVPEQGVIGTL